MDDDRFDTLLRMLATAPSRRTALRLLAGTALRRGIVPLAVRNAASHDALKKCKKFKDKAKKKCVKKAKAHNASHTTAAPAPIAMHARLCRQGLRAGWLHRLLRSLHRWHLH